MCIHNDHNYVRIIMAVTEYCIKIIHIINFSSITVIILNFESDEGLRVGNEGGVIGEVEHIRLILLHYRVIGYGDA